MKSAKGSSVSSWQLAVGKFVLSCVLCLVSLVYLQAQHYPEKPNPPRLVNDFAGMLSSSENQMLEDKLVAYSDSTSTQISIVIISSLEGMERAQYATELGEKWGIGKKHKDNGVLILVSKGDRQIFIATGRGVEEYIPDAICNRIIENKIKPNFKAGNYYEGLDEATTEMIARLSGSFVNDDKDDKNAPIPFWAILIILFIVFFILPFIFRNKGGGTTYGRSGWGGGPFWGGGGFGGGGSSGGGGFGGFGGGGFGGGGAGGSW